MKTFLLDYARVHFSSLLSSLFLLGFATVSLSQPAQPVITSIRLEGTNVVIVARVPAGIRKVTLETRSHIGKGSWEPRLVQRLNDAGGELIFRLLRSANLEMLRVRADATEALPGFFYQGTNTFSGPPTGGAGPFFLGALEDSPTSNRSSSDTREVVESDIWKVRGDTLYFFNQYRGLQIIDLANPDAPVLRGTLNLPAAGEQMYLLDTNHVVLLTRRCSWTSSDSAVLIVNVSGAVPQVVATLPVTGMLQESRLVGTALYVASETYRPVTIGDPDSGSTWEWGSIVSAFDLSDPTTPVAQTTLWYPGSGNVITATDRFLFVSMRDTNNWWRSVIRCVDISARDGKMQALATIRPAGSVADKFKMNLSGDVLTTISEAWSDQRQWVTTLETFSISNPLSPQKLGNLEIKAGERLFATRFDGLVAYVVTFQRIDPLFVINLADPKNPRIAGQVEVPGWSTYIHPLGDRLLTMGVENVGGWHVAVSLFDVHDPAHPALLSRIPVGENNSWSEANYDEKAFSVLPEIGLLLVPYQGYSTNGYSTRVQLIDLLATNLVARGAIEHKMQPRRATVHRERVISLSGWELLTVDATDRDHPAVKSQTELAWQVDRVFLQGNYLLELANGASWNNETSPTLRVALADQPGRVLNTFVLTNVPLLGAVVRNDQLFVAQGKAEGYWLPPSGDTNPPPVSTNLILSVFDLASLPQVGLTGQTFAVTPPLGWSLSWAALWPKPGVLVWSSGSSFWGWGWLDWGWGRPVGLWWPWWSGGGGSGRLLAFDVSNAGAPKFLSDVNLTTSNWWSFSSAFSAENSIYLSHQTSEFLEGVLPPGPLPTPPPSGTWVQRSYLDVVDYTDPVNPTTRKPVNIPGTLKGLSYQGALLYTVGSHYDPATGNLNWDEWLDASAYDGVSGHLVDSLALPKTWPHPVLVDGSTIFLGRPAETTNSTDVLEAWTLPMSGRFAKLGTAQLTSPAQNLTDVGNLLAVQSSYQINLFDPAYPSALKSLGASQENGCLSFDLSQADGRPDRGLWIPLGGFGVEKVDLFSPLPSP